MRELKFRAWDKETKTIILDTTIHAITFSGEIWKISDSIFKDETKRFEIMQFTGLKDKNGKEIYEGDIMYVAGVGNVEIIFNEGCFGYMWEGGLYNFYEDQEGDIERVIGNIYENPELLKDQCVKLGQDVGGQND